LIEKKIIFPASYSSLRIDGKSTNKERQNLIDTWNKELGYFVFLLSTKVGAEGLNLTSADRVIIVDPAWNNLDNQAVARVARIGQVKNVVTYRLITSNTIEEKIYRKQVYKGSLMKNIFESSDFHRYFSSQELSELFTYQDSPTCTTLNMLNEKHQRKTYPELTQHTQFLQSIGIIGISDHDLLYSDDAEVLQPATDEFEEQEVSQTPRSSRKPKLIASVKTQKIREIQSDPCHFHTSQNVYSVHRCSCNLSESELRDYNKDIRSAIEKYHKDQLLDSLSLYIKALETCDEDQHLHDVIISISKKLNLM